MEEHQLLLAFEPLEGKLRRQPERLQQIQRLHHCAFRKQWKADNKSNDDKAMEAAFLAQQKQMGARKIRVNICFATGARTSLQQILNSDTDTLLAAIYVKGLTIETIPVQRCRTATVPVTSVFGP
jgi:hypothetical protein